MVLSQYSRVIGVFPSRETAGQALDQLILSGFPLEKVVLVGKDFILNEQSANAEMMSKLVKCSHADATAGTASGLTRGLIVGNLSGGFIGILLGFGILVVPGVGEAALMGAIACTLLGSSIGTAVGGAIGALIDLGVSEKQARNYCKRLLRGDYLVIVNGTDDEIQRAEFLLKSHSIQT